MNYRHAFHAGNFADVFKHAVLSLCLDHLRAKPAAFRVIDVFAGVGVYDLASPEAEKTGEWRSGVDRIWRDRPQGLEPYFSAIDALNRGGRLRRYPGSPAISQFFLRAEDRLVANELHPADAATLKSRLAGDRRVKVSTLDAWLALRGMLPPPERRGLILVDPPFEKDGEFDRMVRAVRDIRKRFATGVAIFWYPIKAPDDGVAFVDAARSAGFNAGLDMRLLIRTPKDKAQLNGCGVTILNPPWRLEALMAEAGVALASRLAVNSDGRYSARAWTRAGDQPLDSSLSS